MKHQKELIGAGTSLLVLAVLNRDASYGYEIVKRLNAESGGAFLWREGTVYPVLHKLEKEGFVRMQWQQSDAGRERKYYYITAPGREALSRQQEAWSHLNGIVMQLVGESHA